MKKGRLQLNGMTKYKEHCLMIEEEICQENNTT
jgi:hypothetical protein